MPTETLGLRDRKRLETRQRLEQCAMALVLRDGLDNATVDAISDLADVSPRTFFNYFDSKEDAVLGLRDVELTDELIAEHIAADPRSDAVESIVRLIVTMLGTSIDDHEARTQRIELIMRHPQLMGRQFAQMSRMTDRLKTAVTAIIAHDNARKALTGVTAPTSETTSGPSNTDSATAELVIAVCGAAVRVAVTELAAAHSAPDTEQLQQRAVVLVREVVQKLA